MHLLDLSSLLSASNEQHSNPGGQKDKAWCYVANSSSESNSNDWEYCDIPKCELEDLNNLDEMNDRSSEDSSSTDDKIKSSNAICYSKVNDCGCPNKPIYQSDYRGSINVTMNGFTCQHWNLLPQYPHVHVHTSINYPNFGLQDGYGNSCRNPDLDPNGAWCYTTDLTTRWDYCNVPKCYAVNGTTTNIFDGGANIDSPLSSTTPATTSGTTASLASFSTIGFTGYVLLLVVLSMLL